MVVIDLTPGLAPALLLNSRLPVLIRAAAFVLATGFTAGVAAVALHLTRRGERSQS